MTATADSTRGRRTGLPGPARLYLFAVYAGAFGAVAVTQPAVQPSAEDWWLAALLGGVAAVAQMFVVVTPRNQSYHLTPGIVVAAAILLPPPLIAVVVVAQHLPEWLKERYPWFIQSFNIANYTLAAIAAGRVFERVSGLGGTSSRSEHIVFFAAGLAAGVAFVCVQHVLLAFVLKLARGHTLRGTGLFEFQNFSMDVLLALMGVVVAALWEANPFLIAFALLPLVLVHRTLALPKLEAEAQLDPKTGLYNARHFTAALDEAVERAYRNERPVSLLVADLDLLREINNRFGHLAGDAVLAAVAQVLQREAGHDGVAARFGGEEFCVLLPGVGESKAVVVAERIRGAVAGLAIPVQTSSEPISATVSIGVSSLPEHATDAQELIHRADTCAYRAKAQGRNRVVASSALTVLDDVAWPAQASLPDATSPEPPAEVLEQPLVSNAVASTAPVGASDAMTETPSSSRPPTPNLLSFSRALQAVVVSVTVAGVVGGLVAVRGFDGDIVGVALLIALVATGQALAVEALDHSTISLSAVGSLAGAALFGPAVALPIAIAVTAVEWSARRTQLHQALFNVGSLTLSGLAGAATFAMLPANHWAFAAGGALAGAAYYAVNVGLLTTVIALDAGEPWLKTLRERFAWLFVHYVAYGAVGATIALAYDIVHVLALFVFAVPLILVRKAQLDYIGHTEAHVRKLRDAAKTIEGQNESLVRANALLRERATEAMESLAAAVDARDAYTAGHSRRVQEIAVHVGRELGLDGAELESLSFAALFHDVGKLAVPDSVLLKSGPLQSEEWWVVRRHAAEGERIIGHLGFLADATPAIRHHHEHFDGSGYPDGLEGEAIPLGARIIHVADAFDSMSSDRVYRNRLSPEAALAELRREAGAQFCPRCVGAFEAVFATGVLGGLLIEHVPPEAA
jgi:diguanylate cyclase (GGDEF)-like protein